MTGRTSPQVPRRTCRTGAHKLIYIAINSHKVFYGTVSRRAGTCVGAPDGPSASGRAQANLKPTLPIFPSSHGRRLGFLPQPSNPPKSRPFHQAASPARGSRLRIMEGASRAVKDPLVPPAGLGSPPLIGSRHHPRRRCRLCPFAARRAPAARRCSRQPDYSMWFQRRSQRQDLSS
jgi:hypothetical protein